MTAPAAIPAPGAPTVLQVRGLVTQITSEGIRFDVVRHVDLEVRPNEVLALVGESGCGKTMTALSIIGLIPKPAARITEGSVLFQGRDLLRLKPAQMRRIRGDDISMIFQDPLTSLDPVFTVGQVLVEVIRTHRDVSRAEAKAMAVEALQEVHLADAARRMDYYPHQLSGGMRQRVMIALATVLDPVVLIADEPTTALDVTVQAQILETLRHEQQEREMAMLLITHDLAVVASVADRVAVMYSGEIVEEATVDDLFENPRHPYSQGLLMALPDPGSRRPTLHSIEGRVPPPQFTPPGCYFAPRCPHAIDRCWEEHPELEEADGRLLRCFNPQPVA